MKEQLIALFAGAKPSVSMYHKFLNSMPPEKRGIFCKEVYGIALSEWDGLTQAYRIFLVRLIKSERQEFIDYVRNDTAIGQFLYASEELNLFLKMLNILEQPRKNHKSSYTELSFSLLLSFDIDMKVKTLSDKIRYAKADTYDFADLLEKSGEVG